MFEMKPSLLVYNYRQIYDLELPPRADLHKRHSCTWVLGSLNWRLFRECWTIVLRISDYYVESRLNKPGTTRQSKISFHLGKCSLRKRQMGENNKVRFQFRYISAIRNVGGLSARDTTRESTAWFQSGAGE